MQVDLISLVGSFPSAIRKVLINLVGSCQLEPSALRNVGQVYVQLSQP